MKVAANAMSRARTFAANTDEQLNSTVRAYNKALQATSQPRFARLVRA